MRTGPDRHRIPDVCVTLSEPDSNVLEEAPFIAIEILSEDDSVTRLIEKLKEYAAMGVPNIWVFDPRLREMFTFHDNALREVTGDSIVTGDPRIELTREEIFRN